MTHKFFKTIILVALASSVSGCLPGVLNKYRNGSSKSAGMRSGEPAADINAGNSVIPRSTAKPKADTQKTASATIYAIDQSTYRFLLKEGDVWNGALDVLMRNYNLTIVDKATGIITTEWDSYYLNNAVFRNKVSMRINRSSWNAVDVTIHNNVEKLRDASEAADAVGAVWLPSEDNANETTRIVQNMALILNQPPPILPPGVAVARGVGNGTTRK